MFRSVLVTGGAQRLGAEIVRSFAKSGWHVWCHYQTSSHAALKLVHEVCEQGGKANVVQADLSNFSQIEAMMREISPLANPIDVVINNASMFEPDTGASFTPAMAQAQLNVNLLAPMFLGQILANQHAAATNRKSADACIIHILDQKVFNLNPDYFSYTLSKLALQSAVALQAQALAPKVRVCAVAPGLMFQSGPQSEKNFKIASHVNLLQKPISPTNVAEACYFLAMNASITGTTISVDNGQHLIPLNNDVMNVVEKYVAQIGADREC